MKQAMEGGFLERWKVIQTEFLQVNQRSTNDTISLMHCPDFFYHVSRSNELNFQATLPLVVEKLTETFFEELAKGATGAFKVIP